MKTLIIGLCTIAAAAQAHEVWVSAPSHVPDGEILTADLGYGDYPYLAPIAAARLPIFPPITVINQDGEVQTLVQKGKNYQYRATKPLAAGSYWATAAYRPTFWSQNADGWKMDNLQSVPDAGYCEQTQMFGKSLVTVGKSTVNEELVTTRIGLPLEIVPLADPDKIKVGEPFPLQIIYNDTPLAGETVIATADTVVVKDLAASADHREVQGFSGKTDKHGRVNFIPLTEGIWKLKVIHKTPFADPKICQYTASYSTLILPVGKGITQLPPLPEHHH